MSKEITRDELLKICGRLGQINDRLVDMTKETRDELLKIGGRLGQINERLDLPGINENQASCPILNTYIANGLGFSGTDQAGKTPDKLLEHLDTEFHFDFDPCPVDPKFNGLNISWGKMNYVNPPYNDITQWVTKALSERDENGSTSVFLIPFRPHTKYFNELIATNADEIRFFKHKFAFKGYKRASLAVSLVIFRPLQFTSRVITDEHDRRFGGLNIPRPRTVQNALNVVSSLFSFDRIDTDRSDVEVISDEYNRLVLAHQHPEAFIDRAATVFKRSRKTIAIIIPMRVEASYFLDKIVFGSASHVIALSPTLAMPGFDNPCPTGSVLIVYTDTPCQSLFRADGFRMSIIEENFHRVDKRV